MKNEFPPFPKKWLANSKYQITGKCHLGYPTVFIKVCTQHVTSRKPEDAFINGDFMEISYEFIKQAHSFGHGTMEDFKEYAKINKPLGFHIYSYNGRM